MKSIYVTFEDEEMKQLKEIKGKESWHDLIMQLMVKK